MKIIAAVRARLVNPVVRTLLRSRLHALLSGSTLLLDYTGRRTGGRYVLPVGFAQTGDDLVLVAGQAETKTWWRNFDVHPQEVTLILRGQTTPATASRPTAGSEDYEQAMRTYRTRFPRAPLDPAAPVLIVRVRVTAAATRQAR